MQRLFTTLEIHEKIHTGEKPLACITCDKGSLTAADLKTHESIHLKQVTQTLDGEVSVN